MQLPGEALALSPVFLVLTEKTSFFFIVNLVIKALFVVAVARAGE